MLDGILALNRGQSLGSGGYPYLLRSMRRRLTAADLPPRGGTSSGTDGATMCFAAMAAVAAAGGGSVPLSGLPSGPGSFSQRRIALRLAAERSRVTGIEFGSSIGNPNVRSRSCTLAHTES